LRALREQHPPVITLRPQEKENGGRLELAVLKVQLKFSEPALFETMKLFEV
jgi:hypothetical protein